MHLLQCRDALPFPPSVCRSLAFFECGLCMNVCVCLCVCGCGCVFACSQAWVTSVAPYFSIDFLIFPLFGFFFLYSCFLFFLLLSSPFNVSMP